MQKRYDHYSPNVYSENSTVTRIMVRDSHIVWLNIREFYYLCISLLGITTQCMLVAFFSMQNDALFAMNRLTPKKRSTMIDDGFHIGCLPSASAASASNISEYISTKWTCESCALDFYSNPAEKFEHLQSCRVEHQSMADAKVEEADADRSVPVDPLAKAYDCEVCGERLWLTPINILKHRRSHQTKTIWQYYSSINVRDKW